jgi:ABC-type Fe3+/spermidine/putrescine transport system ATPase subunit
MLLLDEPLSALDEKIRRAMQLELKQVQRRTNTTFLYVTHDQEEALTLSDRIAIIDRGRCVECDVPERLYRRPRRRFVAEFFRGCNVLDAEPLGWKDGSATYRLGGVAVRDVPVEGEDAPGRHLALRAENVHLGVAAQNQPYRLPATLSSRPSRATNRSPTASLPLAAPVGSTWPTTTLVG